MLINTVLPNGSHGLPAEPKPERTLQVGDTTTVDRWIDGQWVAVTLRWDGVSYVRVCAPGCNCGSCEARR